MYRKIGGEREQAKVNVRVDGEVHSVDRGEPVAAILLRLSDNGVRRTPISGAVRAPFCMMGACFDCLVEIDGRPSTRSCMTFAQEGMEIRRQMTRPNPSREHAA
ncbi:MULTISPECIES: (2Fe-2S)-binding protein [unclassified Sphingobium]|uniref:(2Fe-2S)-binding protein n=1 Tax=unclassified Sphingobium TaxID=2611147 RepID=UPI0035A6E4FF